MRDQAMLITKATGITVTRVKPTMIGENGAWLMKVLLARNTSADTPQAMKKATQNALRVPCLDCVLHTAEMMIPANAGPQVATKAKGASRKCPLFITAS